jgi:hypothetical protein
MAFRSFLLLLSAVALCGSLCAQSERTITIRMIDGKTGKLIEASNYQVRIDHDQTVHANWVAQNEDGSGKLTLPRTAQLLTIQGTFDSAEQIYLNCDAAGEKGKTARWYDIAEILAKGVVAPNECITPRKAVKPKIAAKLKMEAKPGEFIFFVRKRNMLEQAQEEFADR